MTGPNGRVYSDPEQQAFESELIALQPQLHAYARSLTGSRDEGEELAQEATFKALKSRHLFRTGTNLRAWLFIIARNYYLSERRRDRFRAPYDPEVVERVLAANTDIAREAEDVVDLKRMLLCLASLPHHQGDALMAVGYVQLSYEEAAERLGCAMGTIKSRVSRGRIMLTGLFNSQAEISIIDLSWFKKATQGIPTSHPYFPIAKAYEEVFALFEDTPRQRGAVNESESEKLWNDLVSMGALDVDEGLDSLMRA